jgi:hypothetical protein
MRPIVQFREQGAVHAGATHCQRSPRISASNVTESPRKGRFYGTARGTAAAGAARSLFAVWTVAVRGGDLATGAK